VQKVRLLARDLRCELIISTPASGLVSTNSVCVGCSIVVAGRKFKMNLICLPLEGLNIILGMDWLSINHIIIDCGWRRVVFLELEGLWLISTQKALKEIVRYCLDIIKILLDIVNHNIKQYLLFTLFIFSYSF